MASRFFRLSLWLNDLPDDASPEQQATAVRERLEEIFIEEDDIELATRLSEEPVSPSRPQILDLAREQWARDPEIQLDNDAVISAGDDNGAYVQAWVWVDFSGTELDKEEVQA